MCTDWVLQPGSLSSEAKALYRALYGDLLESSAQAFPRLCFRLKGHLLAEPFLLNGRLGYRLRRVGRGYVREKFSKMARGGICRCTAASHAAHASCLAFFDAP